MLRGKEGKGGRRKAMKLRGWVFLRSSETPKPAYIPLLFDKIERVTRT